MPNFFQNPLSPPEKGLPFHHRTQTCPQGRACVSQSCGLRHPPECHLFAQGWCGYTDTQGIPRRYNFCSFFHPQNVSQIPPTSAVNPQRGDSHDLNATENDGRRETQVETVLLLQRGSSTHTPQPPTGDSDMNQLKEELGEANAKITKLEQSIQQLKG